MDLTARRFCRLRHRVVRCAHAVGPANRDLSVLTSRPEQFYSVAFMAWSNKCESNQNVKWQGVRVYTVGPDNPRGGEEGGRACNGPTRTEHAREPSATGPRYAPCPDQTRRPGPRRLDRNFRHSLFPMLASRWTLHAEPTPGGAHMDAKSHDAKSDWCKK